MRNDKEHLAIKAQQLLDDEVLKGAFDAVEREIITNLKRANLDGSEAASAFAVELARKLQTVEGVKAALRARVTNWKLANNAK